MKGSGKRVRAEIRMKLYDEYGAGMKTILRDLRFLALTRPRNKIARPSQYSPVMLLLDSLAISGGKGNRTSDVEPEDRSGFQAAKLVLVVARFNG
jgi:hypothetical protein